MNKLLIKKRKSYREISIKEQNTHGKINRPSVSAAEANTAIVCLNTVVVINSYVKH